MFKGKNSDKINVKKYWKRRKIVDCQFKMMIEFNRQREQEMTKNIQNIKRHWILQ